MIFNFKFIILAIIVIMDNKSFCSIQMQHDTNKLYNNDFQLCIELTILNCETEDIIFLCDFKNKKMYVMKCFKGSKDETCNLDSCMKNSFNNIQGSLFCNEIKHKCQEISLSITGKEFYIPYNDLSKIQNTLINNSFNGTSQKLFPKNSNNQRIRYFLKKFVPYTGFFRSKTDNKEKYVKLNNELKGNILDMQKYILSNKTISTNDLNISHALKESDYSQFVLGNFTYYPNIVSQQIHTINDLRKGNITHKTICIQFFSGGKMYTSSKSIEIRKFKRDLVREEKSDSSNKNFLNTFTNVAYLKEVPKQSHSDNLETDLEFKCLQNGIHCGDDNVLLHCVQISPDSKSELIPLFIFPCKVGAEGKDIISSKCLNNSCSVSVGNETTNLYLLPLLPGSLCDKNLGTRCISITLLLICTNNNDLPNYIVDCSGMQQRSNYFQNIQGRCDEMSSTCILDRVNSDWNNVTEVGYAEDTLPVTLPTNLYDPYQTSSYVITNVSTSTITNEINNFEKYDEVPLIKISGDLNIQCWKSGWHCYNENILLFCSDELMVYNLTSCPDQYNGKKKSYCNIETAKCQDVTSDNLLEYTEIDFKCQKKGLQCINGWKLADCGSSMEILFIISCKILFPLDPQATCNKTTDRCQSLQSDLNLLSTSYSSEEDTKTKQVPETQIRDEIAIAHENSNKSKTKNKGGSNVAINMKRHPYRQNALRAFKSIKWQIKKD